MNELPYYENEIDLRQLLLALWNGKKIILVAGLLAALAALVISLILPPEYQASAWLTVQKPVISIGANFNPTAPDLATVSDLAKSSEFLVSLVAKDAELSRAFAGDGFKVAEMVSVSQNTKSQQIQIQVKDADPQRAALLANRIAQAVTEKVNATYGGKSFLESLDSQINVARGIYQEKEATYQKALADSPLGELQALLAQAKSDLACIVARQSYYDRLAQDLNKFTARLQQIPPDEALLTGDHLALITLQQSALVPLPCPSTFQGVEPVNVQWQLAPQPLTAAAALQSLHQVQSAIEKQQAMLQTLQPELAARVAELQRKVEEQTSILNESQMVRDQALDAYTKLQTLASSTQVLPAEALNVVQVVAEAVPPKEPTRNVLMNTALALALGLILGAGGVLAVNWWQESGRKARQ